VDWQTLVAVAVGAGLTFGASVALEWIRRGGEDQRRRDANLNELRAAFVLVRHELIGVLGAVEEGLLTEHWPADSVSHPEWDQHAVLLARGLPHEQWTANANALSRADELVAMHFRIGGIPLPIEKAQDAHEQIQDAYKLADRILFDLDMKAGQGTSIIVRS